LGSIKGGGDFLDWISG